MTSISSHSLIAVSCFARSFNLQLFIILYFSDHFLTGDRSRFFLGFRPAVTVLMLSPDWLSMLFFSDVAFSTGIF